MSGVKRALPLFTFTLTSSEKSLVGVKLQAGKEENQKNSMESLNVDHFPAAEHFELCLSIDLRIKKHICLLVCSLDLIQPQITQEVVKLGL